MRNMKRSTLIYLLVIALFILLTVSIYAAYKAKSDFTSVSSSPRPFTSDGVEKLSEVYRNEITGTITSITSSGITILVNGTPLKLKIDQDTEFVKELTDPDGPTEKYGSFEDLKEGMVIRTRYLSDEKGITSGQEIKTQRIWYK
jgi:hypothetical protein